MPLGGRTDRGQQFLRTGILQQVADRARRQHVGDALAVGERRQRDDPYLRLFLEQHPGRGDAVQDRHGQVHQGDVRRGGPGHLQRLAPVGRLPHDLDVPGRLEQRDQAGPDQPVVIDDEHPDHAAPAW